MVITHLVWFWREEGRSDLIFRHEKGGGTIGGVSWEEIRSRLPRTFISTLLIPVYLPPSTRSHISGQAKGLGPSMHVFRP